MLQPSTSPLALALFLLILAATAAQGAAAKRSVMLTGTAGEPPVLYLAPDTVTSILLDAPIDQESVQVDSRARFSRVDPSKLGITLVLRTPLMPNEQLALRFTYQEGSPRDAVLLLTGKPGVVDEVVNVRRPPQAVETCREELTATRERCEAQARELEEWKTRSPAPNLAAMALAGLVGHKGVRGKFFGRARHEESSGLRAGDCRALGAETWSVVVVKVSSTGSEPWVPAWAEVTPEAGGAPRRARRVLSTQTPLPPGGTVTVAIEVEMPERIEEKRWLTVPHTVRVCDETGSRCVSLPMVNL